MGGRGVQAQRVDTPVTGAFDGARLHPWFEALAERLAQVVVLNRDFTSALTPSVIQQTPTAPQPRVQVFLDPPYRTDTGRRSILYHSDTDGSSQSTAERAYAWAVEHGEKYAVAYAMHQGDFPVPQGWEEVVMNFAQGRSGVRDCVMFSPPAQTQARLRLW